MAGRSNATTHDIVFLFDVDNTLLDNDREFADLDARIGAEQVETRDRYWAIFGALSEQRGYADYIGALERYRLEEMHDPHVPRISQWLLDYPFANRLYPGALEALQRVWRWAPVVILSDGDALFQPRKVDRCCPSRAVDGHVLIYIDKEQELDAVALHACRYHHVTAEANERRASSASHGAVTCTSHHCRATRP